MAKDKTSISEVQTEKEAPVVDPVPEVEKSSDIPTVEESKDDDFVHVKTDIEYLHDTPELGELNLDQLSEVKPMGNREAARLLRSKHEGK